MFGHVERLRRTPRALRLQLPGRRFRARRAGRRVRAIRHAGHGPGGSQRRLWRAAVPHGREKGGRPRAHRVGNHLHQRRLLSAAGGNARRLSEPVPPGHPHEAARQKRRRRGHPGRAGRVFPRPDLPHPPSRGAPARNFRQAQRLRRTPAPLPSRRGGAQPGDRRPRAASGDSAGRHQRRRLCHARRSASCSTCSPACARK